MLLLLILYLDCLSGHIFRLNVTEAVFPNSGGFPEVRRISKFRRISWNLTSSFLTVGGVMLTYPLPVVFLLFVSNHLAIRAVPFFESGWFSKSPKPESGEFTRETGEYTRETGEYMRTNTFQLDQCGLISISWFLFVKHFVWFNHVLSIPSMHGLSSPSCVAHRFDQSSIRANFSDSGKFPKLGRIFVAKPPGLKLRAGRQSRYW